MGWPGVELRHQPGRFKTLTVSQIHKFLVSVFCRNHHTSSSISLLNYVDIHTYLPIYLSTYLPIYLPTYLRTYLPTTSVRTYVHTCIRAYMHTYIRTYIHIYTYLYLHVLTYINTCTRYHLSLKSWSLTYTGSTLDGYFKTASYTNMNVSLHTRRPTQQKMTVSSISDCS